MLISSSLINGYAIFAADGRIGTVSDFLFDDTSWFIRWLVVDTGDWLPDRKILLLPSALGELDRNKQECAVKLTMQQVKDSPNIESYGSFSRKMETIFCDYYGWVPNSGIERYNGDDSSTNNGIAISLSPSAQYQDDNFACALDSEDDPHLRSISAIAGYHIHARDGEIGHVDDFLMDDTDWSIDYLVVETKNWWPGKKVMVSPRSVREINLIYKFINVDVDRQEIIDSKLYDSSKPINPDSDKLFHYYYGNVELTDASL
jgi:hypothetical protein